jgi:hypothetical protein
VVAWVEPPKQRHRIVAARTVAAGERLRDGIGRRRAKRRGRNDEKRPGRLDRGRDQALGGNDLEPRGEVEPPAQPRLGDERVEHAWR